MPGETAAALREELAAAKAELAQMKDQQQAAQSAAGAAAASQEASLEDEWNDTWQYLFDVNGYIVVPGVLSDDECERANAAIDRQQERLPGIAPGAHRGNIHGTRDSILSFPGEDSLP